MIDQDDAEFINHEEDEGKAELAQPELEHSKPENSKAKKTKPKASKAQKKKNFRYGVFGVTALLVGLIWLLLQPYKATIHMGICMVYAEQQLRYPTTMRLVDYETFGQVHRIFYNSFGAYGEARVNILECRFKNTADGSLLLESLELDRIDISDEEVEKFNMTIPAILEHKDKIDLVLPWTDRDNLIELKID